jgi:hypothetical protein
MENKRNLAKLSAKTMNSIKGGNNKATYKFKYVYTFDGCGDEEIHQHTDADVFVRVSTRKEIDCEPE